MYRGLEARLQSTEVARRLGDVGWVSHVQQPICPACGIQVSFCSDSTLCQHCRDESGLTEAS